MSSLEQKLFQTVDKERPNAARMYDYFLGGHHNFAIDRELAGKVLQAAPQARQIAFANRAFLGRVVRFLVKQGIDQFLDLGSGIPTIGNVHEIAQSLNQNCRIVYVDQDATAVEHSRLILRNNDKANVLLADIHDTEQILNHAAVNRLIDFEKPVGVLLMAVLHFVTEDDAANKIIEQLSKHVAAGSYIGISQGTMDSLSPELEKVYKLYENSDTPPRQRSRAEVQYLFEGLQLIEPGVVWISEWQPTDDGDPLSKEPAESGLYGGVARKR